MSFPLALSYSHFNSADCALFRIQDYAPVKETQDIHFPKNERAIENALMSECPRCQHVSSHTSLHSIAVYQGHAMTCLRWRLKAAITTGSSAAGVSSSTATGVWSHAMGPGILATLAASSSPVLSRICSTSTGQQRSGRRRHQTRNTHTVTIYMCVCVHVHVKCIH